MSLGIWYEKQISDYTLVLRQKMAFEYTTNETFSVDRSPLAPHWSGGGARTARARNKLAFHDADTDTDSDTDILAKMSACRSACHRNNFKKSRVTDVTARILARTSRIGVGVSVGVVEFRL